MANAPTDRQAVHQELDHARSVFHSLVDTASSSTLRRATNGTRWTNQQMLFHMLFGYLIVSRLLRLVRLFGRMPDRVSATFARVLNAGARPFHVVNYVGSCAGGLVFRGPRLTAQFDRTVAALHRHLDGEDEDALGRTMHFPVAWDPFFQDRMTLLEVYRYGTKHFEFHRQQLSL
jgi:hypothetical protein